MTDTATPSDGSGFSRRRLLGSAAAAGGIAVASLTLPPNVRKALASPLPSPLPSLSAFPQVSGPFRQVGMGVPEGWRRVRDAEELGEVRAPGLSQLHQRLMSTSDQRRGRHHV
jgi:hypothetical protein